MKKTFFSGALVIGILFWTLQSAGQPGVGAPGKGPLTPLGNLDLLSEGIDLKNAPGLIRQGSWAQLRQAKISAGPGIHKSLGEALAKALTEHDRLSTDLDSVKNAALFGAPKSIATVFEFPDSFVITRTTSAVVSDPKALAGKSPMFENFLGKKSPTGRITLADLKPDGIKGMREFMKSEVKKLPPRDPLRLASEKGEESLLQAISDGVGQVELVDTFQIPKSAFPVVGGRLQLPFPSSILSNIRPGNPDDKGEETRATNNPTQVIEKPDLITSGKSEIHSRFIAGFTLGNDWKWERRWNYPSGFFRITLGARYGVGLRIPIKVDGNFSPTRALVKDTRNRPIETTLSIRARAVDGDEAFYKDAGISQNQMFDAKEAVLEAQFGFGYKFRALWTNISDRPFSYIGMDFSKDFTPPTGKDGDAPVIEIPPKLTSTEFDFVGLNGSATFGIRLAGTGSILFDYDTLADGKSVHTRKIESRSVSSNSFQSTIPADAKEYGFRLKNPTYRYDLELIPTVKLSGRVHCSGFSRGISTGWIDLNSLSIDVGTVTLHRHAGTRKSVSFTGGKKEFHQIDDSNYMPKYGDPFHITVNGKYLRMGGGYLKASGDRPEKETLFELSGNGVIRTLDPSYGRDGTPIGVGGIYAVGGRLPPDRREQVGPARTPVTEWEYFKVIPVNISTGEKAILIRSEKSKKYLGIRSDKTLHAEVTDIQKAARFKFWPKDSPMPPAKR